MNIDDISKVLYPDVKAALNATYGYSIPLAFHMSLTLFTRIHMILISVDMIARGDYYG